VVIARCAAGSPEARAEAVRIDVHTISLNGDDPSQATAGQLDFRGGLALSSSYPRFGGFSALGVSVDGLRMVALSDKGTRLSARLVYDERGHLSGI